MDLYDRATATEEIYRAQALEAQRLRAVRGVSARHCQAPDCGIAIPAARRRALPGVQLCIDCQAATERKSRDRWILK